MLLSLAASSLAAVRRYDVHSSYYLPSIRGGKVKTSKLESRDVEVLRKLREVMVRLNADEMKVFEFVWDNISVGEIVFVRDLQRIYGVRNPEQVARELRRIGLIERGEGCYNLASWLRPLRKKIPSFNELKRIIERVW